MIEPLLKVVLVSPQIPPNTGNIARLCVATMCELNLIEPIGFRIEDKYLKRAGLDYWPWVKLKTWNNLDEFIKHNDNGNFYLFTTKASRSYTKIAFKKGDILIFGNEPYGIGESFLVKNISHTYTIPMWGPVRSLNLATSVGIVVYEALRQIKGL